MSAQGQISIKGISQLKAKLDTLEKRAARNGMRRGMNKGTRVVLKTTKANAPVDEGDYQRSFVSKVYGKGTSIQGMVGVDANYIRVDDDGRRKRPVKYDHLIEYGHVASNGTFVPPKAILRRSAAQSANEAEAVVIAALKETIEGV